MVGLSVQLSAAGDAVPLMVIALIWACLARIGSAGRAPLAGSVASVLTRPQRSGDPNSQISPVTAPLTERRYRLPHQRSPPFPIVSCVPPTRAASSMRNRSVTGGPPIRYERPAISACRTFPWPCGTVDEAFKVLEGGGSRCSRHTLLLRMFRQDTPHPLVIGVNVLRILPCNTRWTF